MPDLTFRADEQHRHFAAPSKAGLSIPRWFKDAPLECPHTASEFPPGTVRRCAPFVDALSLGYMLTLPQKLSVAIDENTDRNISWTSTHPTFHPAEAHGPNQFPRAGMNSDELVFKFNMPWALVLPEGYSALYTHPLNRNDLPFRSFSGVVDDGYDSPVNIPFEWIGGNDRVILDEGTPVAQVIPFKREEWDSIVEYVDDVELKLHGRIAQASVDGYRKLFRKAKVHR